jgi:hypothetical protein
LNNAGAVLMRHEAADMVADRITEMYARIAMLVGAAPRNIAIEDQVDAFVEIVKALSINSLRDTFLHRE